MLFLCYFYSCYFTMLCKTSFKSIYYIIIIIIIMKRYASQKSITNKMIYVKQICRHRDAAIINIITLYTHRCIIIIIILFVRRSCFINSVHITYIYRRNNIIYYIGRFICDEYVVSPFTRINIHTLYIILCAVRVIVFGTAFHAAVNVK